MKIISKFTNSSLLTPILFAIFPLLALWETNYSRFSTIEILLPALETLLATFLLYWLARLVIRQPVKAGLFSTLVLLLYFTYGHVYNLIEDRTIFGLMVGRHRVLIIIWLLVFLVATFAILRYGTRVPGLTSILNVAGLAMVILSVFQLVYLEIQSNLPGNKHPVSLSTTTILKSSDTSPDVYFIVLDAYMRSDTIQRELNYDNTAFIKQLTDIGFVLPKCAMSNYTQTALSISSIMNMDYVEKFVGPLDKNAAEIDYPLFTKYINYSLVREAFQKMGYKIISFQEGYAWSQFTNTDVHYQPKTSNKLLVNILTSGDFSNMLSTTTLYRVAVDAKSISPAFAKQLNHLNLVINRYTENFAKNVYSASQKRYDYITYPFTVMKDTVNIPGKKFVYLHIPAPHPDWVVDANGKFSVTTDESKGYPAEVAYLDKMVIPMLKDIIQHSKNPPVIILQGDHGWGNTPDPRMYILNAYYLPGAANAVYPMITPVNTFRTIFNTYFGGNYPLLPDVSYYSNHLVTGVYNWTPVPRTCQK
jgi:hypothetical protein